MISFPPTIFLHLCLDVNPADPSALTGLVFSTSQMGAYRKALPYAENAAQKAPDNPDILSLRIEVLVNCQMINEALVEIKKAVKNFPDYLRFRIQLGACQIAVGDFDNARRTYWECHKRNPTGANALSLASQIALPEDLPVLKTAIEKIWPARSSMEPEAQWTLAFTRGSVLEKLGEYDEAWESYQTGNDLRRASEIFDERGAIQFLNANLANFGRSISDAENKFGSGLIIVVSLPRSGSTLVEQILSSHENVTSIGERGLAFEAFQILQETSNGNGWVTARAHYLKGVLSYANLEQFGSMRIVEKAVTNYMMLGFLRRLLPAAKFVHIVRDPLDNAFPAMLRISPWERLNGATICPRSPGSFDAIKRQCIDG